MTDASKEESPILSDYKAMTRKALKEVLIAEYRCRTKGCVLLHIWTVKGERYFYLPRYRLSQAAVEAETVPAARTKNTEDGRLKWRARAASFDELLVFIDSDDDHVRDENLRGTGLPINCEHVRGTITCRRLVADMDGVTPGAVDTKFLSQGDTPTGLGGAFD